MAPLARVFHSYIARQGKLYRLVKKAYHQLVSSHPLRAIQTELQPAFAKNPRHPIHPLATLKQSKGRYYTTQSAITARNFSTNAGAAKSGAARVNRAAFPKSRVATAISASSGRAPFASTLRPNLTGGALGRTAGGYAAGAGRAGSARYFSHTPAAPAQVVQNVSQAFRAFFVTGQKAHFDGTDPRTGEKRYKTVTTLQDQVGRKMNELPKATPGSFIDFSVNPAITAVTPLSVVVGCKAPTVSRQNLNTEGLLDVLSVDFSRALKELAIILNDLKRLSTLGDLPITYRPSSLRVHFPGCDANTVERLCDEIGVQRGIVGQDEDFDTFVGTEIALLFPFAPSKIVSQCSLYEEPARPQYYVTAEEPMNFWEAEAHQDDPMFSDGSDSGLQFSEHDIEQLTSSNPWLSSPSGYDTLRSSELAELPSRAAPATPFEYQGFEGIYRFMEQCDAADRH